MTENAEVKVEKIESDADATENISAEQKAHQDEMLIKADEGLNTGKDEKLFGGKYDSQEQYDKAIVEAYKKKHGDGLDDAFSKLTGDLSNDGLPSDNKTDESNKADEGDDASKKDDAQSDNTDESDNKDDKDDSVEMDMNLDTFVTEYNTDGHLSEDSYKKLTDAGYDKGMVDTYMAGVTSQRDSLFAICDGKESFFQMTQWAAEDGGFSADDIDNFNTELNSGDITTMKRAVEGLKLRFDASGNKTAPSKKIEATHNSDSSDAGGYSSMADLVLDQSNPLYDKSPEYRQKVLDKVRRSKNL